MSSLRSDVATPAKKQEHDPEIRDMAKYVYNYKVDSDLAVCQNPAMKQLDSS
jgi:2-methylcitrate dehydratase